MAHGNVRFRLNNLNINEYETRHLFFMNLFTVLGIIRLKRNNTIDFLLTKKRDKKKFGFFVKAIDSNGLLKKNND